MFETGQFATLWQQHGRRGSDSRSTSSPAIGGTAPTRRRSRRAWRRTARTRIKAVCVVHNETSTGVTSRASPRCASAIDRAKHPALLMVDTISSLASIDYRHDEWGVDVTVGGSQKGLMLPPGLGFNAICERRSRPRRPRQLPRSYWDWDEMLAANETGFFPYTPATNLLYGLREALRMMHEEEGLDNVFARHARHGEATRRAVRAWGLEVLCLDPAEYSSSLTAVLMPEGHDADAFRKLILERFDMSLGTGLGSCRARSSASATSATSTISCWPARSPAWRWGWISPACRTARAACSPRWSSSPARPARPGPSAGPHEMEGPAASVVD